MKPNSLRSVLMLTVAAVFCGTAAGIASSYYRHGREARVYAFSKPTATDLADVLRPANQGVEILRPRLVVQGGSTHDFGTMSRNERRHHVYLIRNEGNGPLHIRFIDKSCQCTDVTMTKTEVPPGATTEVTLTWQPSTFDLEFHQTARFETNDPSHIELDLAVKGKVQQVIQAIPRTISFNGSTTGQTQEQILRVFAYRDADLTVQRVEVLDPDTAEYFETDIVPMSASTLADETGAVAGQEIRVRLKPGLKQGRFYQRLRLYLSSPDLGPLEVQVVASITGNVTLLGPGYDPKRRYWNLGKLSGEQEQTKTLWIIVNGEDATGVQLKVKRVDPADVLHLEIVSSGRTSRMARHALKLTVRPSGRVVNRLGHGQGDLGELVIETSRPDAPEIRIPVAFAIEAPDHLSTEDRKQ